MSGVGTAYIQAGGANIDTNGQSIIVGQTLRDGGGNGGLSKYGFGTLTLTGSNTYSGGTMVSQGTLLGNTISLPGNIADNAAVVFDQGFPGSFSGAISGSGSVTKAGADRLALTASNTYRGTTDVSAGTLEIDATLAGPAGQVNLQALATLVANASILRPISGGASSQIVATSGNVSLGDSTSVIGFNHAGTLTIGSNGVTLNSTGFANLGTLTTIGGGTIEAPNGISLGVGCSLSGSGTVQGKIAAGYGSTINAAGNLALGDSTSPVGFVSNGELYANASTVTLSSSNAAGSKNAVVLGSRTQIDGGGLVAPNGILLGNGCNLVATDAGGTVSGGTVSRFLNRGNVQAPSSASSNWLTFNLLFKGSTGQTSGRIIFGSGFATGDSPGINMQYGSTELGGTGTEFDLGGTTAGNASNNYGQLNIFTDPNDPSDLGNLVLLPNTAFEIVDWNGFKPGDGDTFTVLTWDGTLTGSASLSVDPAFAADGITMVPQWNANSLVLKAVQLVPEPSTLALVVVGAAGIATYSWRRRREARRTAKASDLDRPYDRDRSILAFPSNSFNRANATRRAA